MLNDLMRESGVLPYQHIRDAISEGVIDAGDFKIPESNIQPASLDLRLGAVGHRIRCSFLPSNDTVERSLKQLSLDTFRLDGEGVVLEAGVPYLIELKESLHLPRFVRARANPKSSTGRADVFTRVISDRSSRFDDIAAGYRGGLYLEVVPLSFPVRVHQDLTLNQLRLSVGRAQLSDADVLDLQASRAVLFGRDGESIDPKKMHLANGLFLSLNLRGGPDRRVGYKARGAPPLLDLSQIGIADPEQFWEHVRAEEGDRIVLDPKRFYLLMSQEAVRIPPELAAEMAAYDPTSGELRTHYAGFFDPGFGWDRLQAFKGSTAALEVRAHDVPFMVEDGQLVCKLTFERMIEAPTRLYGQGVGSNYQRQTETLGKHFFVEGEDRGKRRKGARKVARDAPPEDALELSLEDG